MSALSFAGSETNDGLDLLSLSEFRVSPSPAVKLFDDCWAFDFAEFFRKEDLKIKQLELMKLKDDHKAPRAARTHESSNYDPKEIRKQLLMRM